MNVKHLFVGKIRLILARMDAVDRTHVYASGVLRTDTRFGDYVSHKGVSSTVTR
jgi:hypothetical protein